MNATLIIRDETAAGAVFDTRPLEFPSERITVRDLIRARVYQEVQDHNRRSEVDVFRGLVQPTDAECLPSGKPTDYRLKHRRAIDWQAQFAEALEAFGRHGFFVLIDDRQAESLDEVKALNRQDPYTLAGLFQSVEIRPWKATWGELP